MTLQVDSKEQVVRLLHRAWVVDGVLQLNAFTLDDGESYLSVNRPAVESYHEDVSDFLSKHPQYKTSDDTNNYQRAISNVGAIRGLSVNFEKEFATLSVEVEPRDAHYKSHAGIFVRIEGKSIKGGSTGIITTDTDQVVSASSILQKVRMFLLELSELDECSVDK